MARSDYAHWNEEADLMWWMEEGRFGSEYEPDYDDPYDERDDYIPDDEGDEEIDPDDLVDLDADDSVTHNESRYIEWD